MNTNHDTSTAVTRRNESTQDTAIEMWKKNVESIGTGTSERETFPRERKHTMVVVAWHDETERGTLIENENVIETIIGNQIHHVTDNNRRKKLIIIMIIVNAFFLCFFFME